MVPFNWASVCVSLHLSSASSFWQTLMQAAWLLSSFREQAFQDCQENQTLKFRRCAN